MPKVGGHALGLFERSRVGDYLGLAGRQVGRTPLAPTGARANASVMFKDRHVVLELGTQGLNSLREGMSYVDSNRVLALVTGPDPLADACPGGVGSQASRSASKARAAGMLGCSGTMSSSAVVRRAPRFYRGRWIWRRAHQ
jgi:hypothetical protein